MGRAIVRGDAVYGFPWPTARLVGVVKMAPNALFDAVGRRVL